MHACVCAHVCVRVCVCEAWDQIIGKNMKYKLQIFIMWMHQILILNKLIF